MTDIETFNSKVARLEAELQAKLGVKGHSLSARLNRAGRRLPKRLRQAGQQIADAQIKMQHPKLARLADMNRADRAFADLHDYLDSVDPKDRRTGVILGMLGGMVFNLILLVVGMLLILRWQGLL